MSTTNLAGNVGSASAAATFVVLAGTVIEIAISGTGSARIAKNATAVGDLNATTDPVLVAGSGYRLQLAEVGKPITSVGIYANNSETGLTYAINIIKTGKIN